MAKKTNEKYHELQWWEDGCKEYASYGMWGALGATAITILSQGAYGSGYIIPCLIFAGVNKILEYIFRFMKNATVKSPRRKHAMYAPSEHANVGDQYRSWSEK